MVSLEIKFNSIHVVMLKKEITKLSLIDDKHRLNGPDVKLM